MFGYDDKLLLSCKNFIDKKGNMIDTTIKFPFEGDDFNLPEDVVCLDIVEVHLGAGANYAAKSYKICVGKKALFKQLNTIPFTIYGKNEMINANDIVCYFYDEESSKNIIIGKFYPGDIVVENVNDLKRVLIRTSNNFRVIEDFINLMHDEAYLKRKRR